MGGGDQIDFIGLPLPRYPQSTGYPEASAQRRRRRPTTAAAGPSSGVLSLLASISAASYPVEATSLVSQPTPPPFLCPSLVQEGSVDAYGCASELIGVASSSSSSAVPSPTVPPSSPNGHKRRGSLADRFEKGPDGQWRRVDKYTIYGSTVCISCSADGNGATTSSATTSTVAAAATTTIAKDQYDVATPDGWSAPTPIDTARLKLILSVSLVLSFGICMLMIGVTLYRRRRRRKIVDGDEEIKLQRRKGGDVSEQEALMEQAARVKQKFWALSTARWKASVRSSARRRRNWRKHAAAHSTKVNEPAIPEAPATSRPTSPSPTESTRASIAMDRASTPIPNTVLRPTSPPAYIHPPAPPLQAKVRTVPEPISDSSSSFINDDYDNHNEPAYTGSIPNGELPIPYDDSSLSHPPAAHVATDDKALLAQMADLASAPPSLEEDGDMQISAPAWQDEEIAGPTPPSSPRASTSAIPPPPSHVKTSGFYEYPGDATIEEPEADLPSAPPLESEMEHGASAPPLEGHVGDEDEVLPSAPPMQPSAPGEWDWMEHAGQSHDRHSRTLSSSTLEFLPLPLYRA